MEKYIAFLYFIIFILACALIFYLLIKSNFEKVFKQGKIGEIRVGYVVVTFILATIFAYGVVRIIEEIYTIILK